MKVGDYVLVNTVPEPWESSGEEQGDREALVGHVGVIVEMDDENVLVRFPCVWAENSSGQRNIEHAALLFVSSPKTGLPDTCFDL